MRRIANGIKTAQFRIILFAIILVLSTQTAYSYGQFTERDLDLVNKGQNYRDDGNLAGYLCSLGDSTTDVAANSEEVWRWFADKLPGHMIAGIIGNMAIESGVQPQRLQNTKSGVVTRAETESLATTPHGWGLVQWTPANKIISTFPDRSDANLLANQLTFLWAQLQGTSETSRETGAYGYLVQATSPSEAAQLFGDKYERPQKLSDTLRERQLAAEAAYQRFNDIIPTVDSPINVNPDDEGLASAISVACLEANGTGAAGVVRAASTELSLGPIEYDDNVLKYSDGNREPWCADFVSWVFKEADRPFSGGTSGGWRRPGVLDVQTMFQNTEGLEYFEVGSKAPLPGDVAFYIGDQTPDRGSASHVNIVIEVNGDTMITIGGNESNTIKKSERKIAFASQSLVGFGRVVGESSE